MNFDQWLQLYTERMDDTPGLEQFGRESWDACKKEVLKFFKHPKLNLENNDIKYLKEEIEKL